MTATQPVYRCKNDECPAGVRGAGYPKHGTCPCCGQKLHTAPQSWKVTFWAYPKPISKMPGALGKPKTSVITKSRRTKTEYAENPSTVLVPKGMDLEVAIHTLMRQQERDEEEITIDERVDCHPLDGARALMKVLERRYGWVDAQSTPSFFGDVKPEFIAVEVDYGVHEQVLWGSIGIPGVEGVLKTRAANVGSRNKPKFIFSMGGTIKRKHETAIREIGDEVRAEVKANSIYRGKAFHLITEEDGSLDPMIQPKFMDVSKANPNELLLNADVLTNVKASVFTPLEKTQAVRGMGIPLKRGVLLYGDYGTGKTLTAHCTAKLARENGWTFVYLDRPEALHQAIQFCNNYGPTVIFAEDIDRAVSKRDDTANMILNTLDGIGSKGTDVMVILTSNHAERISPAMLRPGRLDHKIHVRRPDKDTVERLIRLYGGTKLPENADVSAAAKVLEGQIPAVIREAVDRAGLYALAEDGSAELLSGDALTASARSMADEIALLTAATEPKPTSEKEKLGGAVSRVVEDVVKPLRRQVKDIADHVM